MLNVNRAVRGAVWTMLPDPLTTPINKPPGDSPKGRKKEHLLLFNALSLPSYPLCVREASFVSPHVRDLATLGNLFPTLP
jgi:hypothetical protein